MLISQPLFDQFFVVEIYVKSESASIYGIRSLIGINTKTSLQIHSICSWKVVK